MKNLKAFLIIGYLLDLGNLVDTNIQSISRSFISIALLFLFFFICSFVCLLNEIYVFQFKFHQLLTFGYMTCIQLYYMYLHVFVFQTFLNINLVHVFFQPLFLLLKGFSKHIVKILVIFLYILHTFLLFLCYHLSNMYFSNIPIIVLFFHNIIFFFSFIIFYYPLFKYAKKTVF